jgi:hypothetical protein
MGDGRRETGDVRRETGDVKRETGDVNFICPFVLPLVLSSRVSLALIRVFHPLD